MFTSEGKMEQEITAGLRKGCNLYPNINHLVWDKHIPTKANITMLKTYFIPIFTYEFEEGNITEKEWSVVQASKCSIIRINKDITCWDRIRNEVLRKRSI